MPDKPTKKWLEDQINFLVQSNLQNQGAINLCRAMLEKEIYVGEETVTKDGEVKP